MRDTSALLDVTLGGTDGSQQLRTATICVPSSARHRHSIGGRSRRVDTWRSCMSWARVSKFLPKYPVMKASGRKVAEMTARTLIDLALPAGDVR